MAFQSFASEVQCKGQMVDENASIYWDIPKDRKVRRVAKLFRNGRSQAVRLPSDLRFEGSEVFIRQDPATGDVILSRRPDSWDSFFELRWQAQVPGEFLADRRDEVPQKRRLLG